MEKNWNQFLTAGPCDVLPEVFKGAVEVGKKLVMAKGPPVKVAA